MALSRSLLPPFPVPSHTPLWYSFPLLPHGRLATKLIVSPPVYACASPRAAPTCCACAFRRLGEGRERGGGTGGRASVLGELSATDHRPVSLISFLALFRLTILLISSYIASHAPDRRAFVTGIPSPQEGFEPHELSGPVQFICLDSGHFTLNFSLLICAYSPPSTKIYGL